MPINSWNTKTNVVELSYFWMSRFVDHLPFDNHQSCSSYSRNQLNKVGARLSKLMKQLYNWKRMFIKLSLNCTHLLANTSMLHSTSFPFWLILFRFSVIHTLLIIWKPNSLMNKWNQSRNIPIILPTWNVLVQVSANTSSTKIFRINIFQFHCEEKNEQ